jgi:hypothetical protein
MACAGRPPMLAAARVRIFGPPRRELPASRPQARSGSARPHNCSLFTNRGGVRVTSPPVRRETERGRGRAPTPAIPGRRGIRRFRGEVRSGGRAPRRGGAGVPLPTGRGIIDRPDRRALGSLGGDGQGLPIRTCRLCGAKGRTSVEDRAFDGCCRHRIRSSEVLEEPQERVWRPVAAGGAVERFGFRERLFFEGEVGVEIDLCRFDLLMPPAPGEAGVIVTSSRRRRGHPLLCSKADALVRLRQLDPGSSGERLCCAHFGSISGCVRTAR